jgi:hypothetical protein
MFSHLDLAMILGFNASLEVARNRSCESEAGTNMMRRQRSIPAIMA